MLFHRGIKLKFAISILLILTSCSTVIINWYISSNALKHTLTENYLENNYQYANKVASSTNDLLYSMEQNLRTFAEILGQQELSQSDIEIWKAANSGFYNSIFTTDANGVVQLMSPLVLEKNTKGIRPGVRIESNLMKKALADKKPFISNPYIANTGNLVVLVSYPIFDKNGIYKGVVDGTIYLESDSSLSRLLNNHHFLDKSSVFVVDNTGRIIYHPDKNRINESIADHPLVQNVLKGNNGSAEIMNNKGVEYFSGYAYVKETGWGVIAQTPTSVVEEPLYGLTRQIIIQSLPMLFIILLISSIFTNYLAKPLNTLARFSERATTSNKEYNHVFDLDIKSHIYEVHQLYKHVQNHFQLLNSQVQQDGLTGLQNRRSFDIQIKDWFKHQIPYSLIMLDIDRFKRVNDEFGHLAGDDVLKFLAALMEEISREEDLCYRYGGEEFIILLKGKNREDAYNLAERLREKVAITPSPTGQPITISLGIASSSAQDAIPEEVIKRADLALYRAKNKGRNRTETG